MEPRRNEIDVAGELLALRPQPRPEFVAELDSRAAAGFPAGGKSGGSALGHLTAKLGAASRYRLPAFAGAAAMLAIAIATAVIAISEGGPDAPRQEGAVQSQSAAGGGDVLGDLREFSGRPSAVDRTKVVPSGAATERLRNASGEGVASSELSFDAAGPYAAQAARREVERSARLVLATEASGVRAAAAAVLRTAHSHDGIVLRSTISDGVEDPAGASFELLIPSARLGDALADLSTVAEVRSRQDLTADVTGRAVGLDERLRDSRARIESLLAELADANTEAERTAVEARLRSERRQVAALRSAQSAVQRRVNFSRVSLRIETGPVPGSADDGWGISDALDDAGRILAIAAGVTLIGLALLAPVALIGCLVWLARRNWIRRSREQAIG